MSVEARVYEKHSFAGWGDMDFNAHMRNTAFLDKSADVRMMFFAENGFPTSEVMRRSLGPVSLMDELENSEPRIVEKGELQVLLARSLVTFIGGVAALYSTYWAGGALVYAFGLSPWISYIGSLAAGGLTGRYIWRHTASTEPGFVSAVMLGALITGGIGCLAGVFGRHAVADLLRGLKLDKRAKFLVQFLLKFSFPDHRHLLCRAVGGRDLAVSQPE